MVANDKHERLMAEFERQQVEAAEEQKKKIAVMIQNRGGLGINEETIQVMSEMDVRQRELDLKRGKTPTPISRNKMEITPNPVDRMKRYSG
jgi:F0F1-type ATP synthase epsilon subunit